MFDFFWIGFLFTSAALAVAFGWWRHRFDSIWAGVLSRWARWIFAGSLLGWLLHQWVYPEYPVAILVAVGLLIWFLLETTYFYLAISALSRSELPLFPRFKESDGHDTWPTGRRFLVLREAIRRGGFERLQYLVAPIAEGVVLRLVVFANKERTVLLSVYFLPTSRARVTASLALQSDTAAGERLITDNFSMPFGGFYPESWSLERRPLTRQLGILLSRHMARVDARGEPLVAIEADPLTRLNADQRRLEKLNRELGFLAGHDAAAEEGGAITAPGRYRIWKEVWMLSYFARPLRY